MGKHYCKVCGKHLGYHKLSDSLPFRCLGKLVDGKWECRWPNPEYKAKLLDNKSN